MLVPRGAQFVATVRELAAQAARYAKCSPADTDQFVGSVESALHDCLGAAGPDRVISIVVRRDAGPLELVVDGRAITVDP